MYLLVIFLPLLGCLISGFLGRFLGSLGSSFITIICMFFTVFLSFFIFYEVGLCNSVCSIQLFPWLNLELFFLNWGFFFDSLTSIMLIVINVVSFLVHIFSINYMSEDPHLSRFMSYLSLFTFFMLILVTGDNFIQLFVGWEGVGLASYLLINFWFTRLQANKSAIKAIIVNRIGDFGLILSLSCIFFVFGSLDFFTIFNSVFFFKDSFFNFFGFEIKKLSFIGFFLFVGAIGKSAQLGLHVWLPDAMEGPTPVSALIHAATMVTAGVFVLIRCSPILEYSSNILFFICIIGGLTSFFAATTGLLINDLKRVIAYSTCSQLGYMVFACGLSNYSVSLFHLMNHAFFKALLFLSAGAVIHAMSDEQDMRKMGGLFKILPFTYTMVLIGSLSLMGFPFLTGFYSKDVILELSFARFDVFGTFVHWLGTISAFFTAFYSFRLLFLTFLSKTNSFRSVIEKAHDAPFIMILPLSFLCFGSIFIGFFFKDMIIGIGSPFFANSIFFFSKNFIFLDAEFLPFYIKIFPVIFSILGAFLALFFYSFFFKFLFILKSKTFYKNFYIFFNKKWFFDIIYFYFFSKKILFFGYNISFKLIDRGFIELLGPLGLVNFFNFCSFIVNKSQSGFLFHYFYIFFLGVLLLFSSLGWVFFIEIKLLFLLFFLLFFYLKIYV